MTADEVIRALLAGELYRPSVLEPPPLPGFYAWWCREQQLGDAIPPIDYEPRPPVSVDWSLLYVGIAPRKPGTRTNLKTRLKKNHLGRRLASSTLRFGLASMLVDRLGMTPMTGGRKPRLQSEEPLSAWMEQSCGVSFVHADAPWTLEREVIRQLRPPLNFQHGVHEFRFEVSKRKSALRVACGLRPMPGTVE